MMRCHRTTNRYNNLRGMVGGVKELGRAGYQSRFDQVWQPISRPSLASPTVYQVNFSKFSTIEFRWTFRSLITASIGEISFQCSEKSSLAQGSATIPALSLIISNKS